MVKLKWDPEGMTLGKAELGSQSQSTEHIARREKGDLGWNSKSLGTLKSREIQFPGEAGGRGLLKHTTELCSRAA